MNTKSLLSLEPIFDDEGLVDNSDKGQLDRLYACFQNDFENSPYIHKGKEVRLILRRSKINIYSEYPESFVHAITRNIRERIFDPERARRINWIRPILENHANRSVVNGK